MLTNDKQINTNCEKSRLCGLQELDATPVLKLIEMLLSIAHEDRQKCLASLLSQQQEAASSQLEHLICSLQLRLLAWCRQFLSDDDEDDGHHHGDRDANDESCLIVQAMIVRCMCDDDHCYDDDDDENKRDDANDDEHKGM